MAAYMIGIARRSIWAVRLIWYRHARLTSSSGPLELLLINGTPHSTTIRLSPGDVLAVGAETRLVVWATPILGKSFSKDHSKMLAQNILRVRLRDLGHRDVHELFGEGVNRIL